MPEPILLLLENKKTSCKGHTGTYENGEGGKIERHCTKGSRGSAGCISSGARCRTCRTAVSTTRRSCSSRCTWNRSRCSYEKIRYLFILKITCFTYFQAPWHQMRQTGQRLVPSCWCWQSLRRTLRKNDDVFISLQRTKIGISHTSANCKCHISDGESAIAKINEASDLIPPTKCEKNPGKWQ